MAILTRFACITLLVACGGKSAPATTSPDVQDHAMTGSGSSDAGHAHDHDMSHGHDHDMAGSAGAKPTEPTKPTEPAKPSEPDPAQVKAELLAAEQAAFEKAKPVFEKNCARCHAKTGAKAAQKKLDHFDMTTYPFGGHHADTIAAEIRKSLGMTGGKATMPYDKKGSVKGDELALIAAWADAFDKAHAGGAHEGMGHGHGEHEHEHKH